MIRTVSSALGILLASAAMATAADKPRHSERHEGIKEAVCVIMPTKGNKCEGVLSLVQLEGHVHITGKLSGLKPGEHGFHVHMFGDLRAPDGSSAGGHYDPHGHKHGGPKDKERHAGDLGNVKAGQDGVAMVDVKAEGLNLHMTLGRSIVVHKDADDLKTQPAGNSGPRIGVGVIGLAEIKK